MTDTTNARPIPTLPALALDYLEGTFTNTLTGEFGPEFSGIVLGYREDRTLWPSAGEAARQPICVNGSEFGPCLCKFADWGQDGTPPDCTDELTLLLWQDEGAQVVTITARRSQVRTVDQYLNMKALLGGVLHDQRVTLRMTPGDGLHRLTLLPGSLVPRSEHAHLAAIAERVQANGAFGGL